MGDHSEISRPMIGTGAQCKVVQTGHERNVRTDHRHTFSAPNHSDTLSLFILTNAQAAWFSSESVSDQAFSPDAGLIRCHPTARCKKSDCGQSIQSQNISETAGAHAASLIFNKGAYPSTVGVKRSTWTTAPVKNAVFAR